MAVYLLDFYLANLIYSASTHTHINGFYFGLVCFAFLINLCFFESMVFCGSRIASLDCKDNISTSYESIFS